MTPRQIVSEEWGRAVEEFGLRPGSITEKVVSRIVNRLDETAQWPKEPPATGANYTAGLWSRRNYAAMIEDFNAGGDSGKA